VTLFVVVKNVNEEDKEETFLCVSAEDAHIHSATLFFDILEAMTLRDKLEELNTGCGHTYTVHSLCGTER
jgi:hypothetical protein